MLHLPFFAHFVVHGIQPHNTVDGFQRAPLPGFDLRDDPVGNLRENRVGDLTVVHLLDVGADVAKAHPQPIQTNNFVGKVNNDETGRDLFKSNRVSYMSDLMKANIITDFEPTDLTVEPGEDKDSILVNLSVTPIDSMEKLYMTIVVA